MEQEQLVRLGEETFEVLVDKNDPTKKAMKQTVVGRAENIITPEKLKEVEQGLLKQQEDTSLKLKEVRRLLVKAEELGLMAESQVIRPFTI